MRSLQEIDAELDKLRKQLDLVKRIVGYYRSLRNWNKGKKEEYRRRALFKVPSVEDFLQRGSVSEYLYFYRTNCPNCIPVKAYLSELTLKGEHIDADTQEGGEKARAFHVISTPTVLFLDEEGRVVDRAHSVDQIEMLIERTGVDKQKIFC